MEDPLDAKGRSAQERFEEIRKFFLEELRESGQSRAELYYRPKPGDAREPTEEELVRRWAQRTELPTNWICAGIKNAFLTAEGLGAVVTSFRYCMPHITTFCSQASRTKPVPL